MTDVPKVFALTKDLEKPDQIVGYGIELPDGTAFAVSWPASRGHSIYSTSSAEEVADLRGADLVWMI